MKFPASAAILAGALICLAGCQRDVRPWNDEEGFPQSLSEWRLFTGNASDLKPNRGVVPYDLNTPLFSDYSTKRRFVWMPPGQRARYRENDAFEFPVGTILAKTFSFPDERGIERLIETRLLVRTQTGWWGLPYVWNAAQTGARLDMAADPVRVTYRTAGGQNLTFNYQIPDANQCKGCHQKSKVMLPLGPKARNLNKTYKYATGAENELVYWTRAGYLAGAPRSAPKAAVWDDPQEPLEARARTYLDVNCGHCHNPEGAANTSGLYLTFDQTDPLRLGFQKVPVSAGRGSGDLLFDAVAGHPEQSILVRRMESTEPKILMPEVGRGVVHREGVALIREWIRRRG